MIDLKGFNLSRERLREQVKEVDTSGFEALALDIFRFQARYNPVYQRYITCLGRNPDSVQNLFEIPFLPVSFFKKHQVVCGEVNGGRYFESSGTTGLEVSRHLVKDLLLYEQLSVRLFESRYGSLKNFHILALLPSYLERDSSSLVYMVQHFMSVSGSEFSGFFLNDFEALNRKILELLNLSDGKKVLLIGVTFALLDWAEGFSGANGSQFATDKLIVMETGGMKGRRKELLRMEVHHLLKGQLGIASVHSEYGMTELVSQAYSSGDGVFRAEGSMKVLIRDNTDPLTVGMENQTGGVNVIDLGNLDSCAFIETADLGRLDPSNNTFEIIGRMDNSDVRGCNLLYL